VRGPLASILLQLTLHFPPESTHNVSAFFRVYVALMQPAFGDFVRRLKNGCSVVLTVILCNESNEIFNDTVKIALWLTNRTEKAEFQ